MALWVRRALEVENSRGGDDDLGVDELLVKGRVLALLVGGGDQRVALVLEPFPQAELVLGGTKQTRNLSCCRLG